MKFTIESNQLDPDTFNTLRHAVGWPTLPEHQARQALANSRYCICVRSGSKNIAMGRLVGDGAMYWYIQDVAILPEYQGQGIGSQIVNHLIEYAKANSLKDTGIYICLMAVKGKEAFYESFGFETRPNETYGAGMIQYIEV